MVLHVAIWSSEITGETANMSPVQRISGGSEPGPNKS